MTMLALILVVLAAAFFDGSRALAFERGLEDNLLDEWLQEQMADVQYSPEEAATAARFPEFEDSQTVDEDLGYATPGHVEEHDYMTAFFDNQDHDAFADTAENAGYRANPEIEDYLADFFGAPETEAQDDDLLDTAQKDSVILPAPPSDMESSPPSDMESYVADYFSSQHQSPVQKIPLTGYGNLGAAATISDGDNAKMDREGYREGATSEDDYSDLFGDQMDTHRQELTSQNLPEDDLELWFQAMNEGDEAEEEEIEGDTSKFNINFMDDFPESDSIFAEAMVQGLDSECLPWKEKIEAGLGSMRRHGLEMQAKMRVYKDTVDAYNAKNAISCERNCDIKCIPTIGKTKCIKMVNGTCMEETTEYNDCGMKQRDPGCEAEEAGCMAEMKPLVDAMNKAKEELDKTKEEMDKEIRRQEVELEGIPKKCLEQGVAAPSIPASATTSSQQ